MSYSKSETGNDVTCFSVQDFSFIIVW